MKTKICILSLLLIGAIQFSSKAQQVYAISSGEMIFSQNQTSFTSAFLQQYPKAELASSNVRFTTFFHFGQYVHYDLNDKFGLYSGLAFRNIGMITDENLPQTVSTEGGEVSYNHYKLIRRQYTLGVPLALKFGSFSKNFYVYGGAEYEMAFHFKEKYWADNYDRSGPKTKTTAWFGNQTQTFLPSVFAGVQLPKGFNLKFTYFLNDFLNSGYTKSQNSQDGEIFNVSDLSRYKESQIFQFSLGWQLRTFNVVK